MQVKRLFVTITILFNLLLPNFSQAQRQQPRVVSIPDANLTAAIREEIGNAITTDTILNLTRLDAPNRGITDLTGLEHAHNLRELDLGDGWQMVNSNTILDFTPIAGLTRLTRLNLSHCGISDASFVSGLTQLTELWLGHNTISDISPLANLKQLNQLYLWNNTISDVSALAELKKLTWLMLNGNNISDISPLAELKQLPGLGLGSNNISDISPLAELKKLNSLYLDSNNISDVSPLAELKKLTSLSLNGNSISDISALAKLTQLTDLGLNGNSLSDVSALAELKKLDVLNLSLNTISDISPIVGLNLTGTEWDRTGLDIRWNPLSYASINTHIPAMQAKGIEVVFDNRTPTTLVKILGIAQQGIVSTALPLPFVVEVRDDQNLAFSGVPVTFTITTGGGTLSATTTKTDTTGKATAHLTTGQTAGTTTVRVTAVDVSQSVEFTATAVLRSAPMPIPDTNLHEKIAETLRKPLGVMITVTDMLKLRTLTANNAGILDLTGLQYASNLTSLTLSDNSISDVSPLADLTQLTTLDLRGNWISDVSPLVGLTQLRGSNNQHGLSLQGNPLSDTAVRTHIPQLQAAGVNVGFDAVSAHERPIVRLIYFRPRDRQPLPDINTQLDRLIKDIQQFYADQMENLGFDRKTFQFETDAEGNAVVYHVIGRLEDTAYHEEAGIIWDEIHEHLDMSKYIYLTALDVSSERIGTGEGDTACGVGSGSSFDKYERTALLPASGGCFNFRTAAHELGHAFGLQHDFRSDAYLMSYGGGTDLSQCDAEWLDVHQAFNSNQLASTAETTIEMLPPSLASPPNAIRLQFKVTDPDGLHQVQLLTPTLSGPAEGFQELIACKRLNGESSNTVDFVTTSLGPANNFVSLQVIDLNGNFGIQIADRTYATSQEFSVDVASLLPPSRDVSIPDPNLAVAIREEIGDAITTHTLLNLTRLEARNRGIKDLTGLEHAHNLKELNLGGEYIAGEGDVNSNTISDFSPIAGLTRLTRLNLSRCGLSDVSFLSDWTQLDSLSLNDNIISDVSALAGLTQLTELYLGGNTISDLSPLARLTQLTSLWLSDNIISDVSALAALTQLKSLHLGDNSISDIYPLTELKQLTSLWLSGNIISGVSALTELTQLSELWLDRNIISDISALAELKELTELGLWNNTISDVSALAKLIQLTSLGIGGNNISDVSALATLTQLTSLELWDNNISDIAPLVKLNLTGREWDRTGLDITGNPLSDASINTHIPAMQAKGIKVVFEDRENDQEPVVQGPAKIEGPWLWVITPTDGRSGASAAASGIDFLSEMSDGAVTESKIATEGATVGSPVGDSVWTLHTLSATRSDNINDMAKAAGLGIGDIDYHVAYGSIALDAPREQQTIMHAGSDDAVKVWLNGELVHDNPVNRGAWDFQDQFPVTLKKGTNILLVAVYEGREHWTGFFGFAADAEYTLIPPNSPRPAWDVNEDGIVDAKDIILVAEALGQEQPENPRLDVNGDGVVDGKDIVLVAEHLGEGDAPAASYLARNVGNRSSLLPAVGELPLGFTLESVEQILNILRAADDGTLAFKRGITNLERLLALFVPENTALLHNYPNPFNPETWIPYQLSEPAEVTLYIYAVNGALVRTLALGYQPAGMYRIRSRAAYWDGRNAQGERVASGVYFYTLFAGDFTATRKMLVRK